MNVLDVSGIRSIYFIGIAGIGMSALARYFNKRGVKVSGYDRDRSDLARSLEEEGISIHYEIDPLQVPEWPDITVYTPAIPGDHPELLKIREAGKPVLKRSEMLGLLGESKEVIAVAGTHGKTTTSTFAAFILRSCGLDCTAFLGGVSLDFAGNFVDGQSEWMVVEADEYDRSFLKLSPTIAVVTAMDPDHLDVYGTADEVERGFMDFMLRIRSGGALLVHESLRRKIESAVAGKLEARNIQILTYGTEAGSDVQVEAIEPKENGSMIRVGGVAGDHTIWLPIPGKHNALNAVAAFTAGSLVGIDCGCLAEAFAELKGIRRRFEVLTSGTETIVIDDYAHHPEEVRAAVATARSHFPGRRLTGVFQPHLYSRTKDFYREFAKELDQLDECVLVELYPAREKPVEGVSSMMIYEEMGLKTKYCVSKAGLTDLILDLDPELLLFMRAGVLDRMITGIKNRMKIK